MESNKELGRVSLMNTWGDTWGWQQLSPKQKDYVKKNSVEYLTGA